MQQRLYQHVRVNVVYIVSASLWQFVLTYRKVPKFWEARNLCWNLPKIQTDQTFQFFGQNDANGIANSEDPDQTAPLGEVW